MQATFTGPTFSLGFWVRTNKKKIGNKKIELYRSSSSLSHISTVYLYTITIGFNKSEKYDAHQNWIMFTKSFWVNKNSNKNLQKAMTSIAWLSMELLWAGYSGRPIPKAIQGNMVTWLQGGGVGKIQLVEVLGGSPKFVFQWVKWVKWLNKTDDWWYTSKVRKKVAISRFTVN